MIFNSKPLVYLFDFSRQQCSGFQFKQNQLLNCFISKINKKCHVVQSKMLVEKHEAYVNILLDLIQFTKTGQKLRNFTNTFVSFGSFACICDVSLFTLYDAIFATLSLFTHTSFISDSMDATFDIILLMADTKLKLALSL